MTCTYIRIQYLPVLKPKGYDSMAGTPQVSTHNQALVVNPDQQFLDVLTRIMYLYACTCIFTYWVFFAGKLTPTMSFLTTRSFRTGMLVGTGIGVAGWIVYSVWKHRKFMAVEQSLVKSYTEPDFREKLKSMV